VKKEITMVVTEYGFLFQTLPEAEINHALELSKVLVHAHANEYPKHDGQMELVAALLYGPVVARTSDEWIGVLEVVKNYPYPYNKPDTLARFFQSTKQFPLRGRLSIIALSPEEFEDALSQQAPALEEVLAEAWIPLYDPIGYLVKHLWQFHAMLGWDGPSGDNP